MIFRKSILAGVCACMAVMAAGVSSAQAAFVYGVNPKSTYLHTLNDSSAADALILDLTSLGIGAGDTITLTVLGDFKGWSAAADTNQGLAAVFSSSDVLGPKADAHRVPGAIDAGVDLVTPETAAKNANDEREPTDIPEDFAVSATGTVIEVPTGASYLFIGARDSFFGDNTDPDGDFALSVAVPEPAALGMLSVGGLALLRRRRG